jgi:hypothetical protein
MDRLTIDAVREALKFCWKLLYVGAFIEMMRWGGCRTASVCMLLKASAHSSKDCMAKELFIGVLGSDCSLKAYNIHT